MLWAAYSPALVRKSAQNEPRTRRSRQDDGDAVLIVNETADAKSSADAVGAARQYSGTIGGVALCQVGSPQPMPPLDNASVVLVNEICTADPRLSQLQVSVASTAITRARTDPARRSPRSIRPLRSSRRCSQVSDVDRRSQVP